MPATYTKTDQKVKIGNRDAVVYKGQRGGRYIKKGGEFVALSKIQSGGAWPFDSPDKKLRDAERKEQETLALENRIKFGQASVLDKIKWAMTKKD
jgi:endonuclease YncB( thermonuclease family)